MLTKKIRQASLNLQFLVYDFICTQCDAQELLQICDEQIEKAISRCMGLITSRIRTHLGLNKPSYQRTPAHGLLSLVAEADGGFRWERTCLINAFKAAV